MTEDPSITAADRTSPAPEPPYTEGEEVWVGYAQPSDSMRHGRVEVVRFLGYSSGAPIFRVSVASDPGFVATVAADGTSTDPLIRIGREPYPPVARSLDDRDPELDSYDRAIVVFVRVQAKSARDADSLAERALARQLSGDPRMPRSFPMEPMRWTSETGEQVRAIEVADVRSLDSAVGGHMLAVMATDRAFR